MKANAKMSEKKLGGKKPELHFMLGSQEGVQ